MDDDRNSRHWDPDRVPSRWVVLLVRGRGQWPRYHTSASNLSSIASLFFGLPKGKLEFISQEGTISAIMMKVWEKRGQWPHKSVPTECSLGECSKKKPKKRSARKNILNLFPQFIWLKKSFSFKESRRLVALYLSPHWVFLREVFQKIMKKVIKEKPTLHPRTKSFLLLKKPVRIKRPMAP